MVTDPKCNKACMDGSAKKKKKKKNWILALDNHRVALPVHFCQVNLEFIMLVFYQGRKTGAPRENPLVQGQEPTTN